MNRKTLLLPLLLLLLIGFFSCEGDYHITYKWTGLDAVNADNLGEKPKPSLSDSIPYKAYVLRLNLFPEQLSKKGRYLDRETPPTNVNYVDSIMITCNKNFSSAYPKGSCLNDCFLIFNDSYLHTSNLHRGTIDITNRYSSKFMDTPIPEYADLLLIKNPDIVMDSCIFFVFFQLRDKTIFRDSTNRFKLY